MITKIVILVAFFALWVVAFVSARKFLKKRNSEEVTGDNTQDDIVSEDPSTGGNDDTFKEVNRDDCKADENTEDTKDPSTGNEEKVDDTSTNVNDEGDKTSDDTDVSTGTDTSTNEDDIIIIPDTDEDFNPVFLSNK